MWQTAAETPFQLRGQVDFRHQHQCLSMVSGQQAFDQLDINLGLAAAGDAVQQPGFELLRSAADSRNGLQLIRIQFRRGQLPGTRFQAGQHLTCLQQTRFLHLLHSFAPACRKLRQRSFAQLAQLQCSKNLVLHDLAPGDGLDIRIRRQLIGELLAADRWLYLPQPAGQSGKQGLPEWIVVIIGTEPEQAEHAFIQRRFVDIAMLDGFELVRRQLGLRHPRDHQADLPAAAKADQHALADRYIKATIQIVEQAVERYIDCNFEDGSGHEIGYGLRAQ